MPEKTLKTKMIEAAYKIVTEGDFDNFSVRTLSKRLNVSHNAMYKHFHSKAELFLEVIKLGFNRLTSAFDEINKRKNTDELTRFKEIIYRYIEFAVENPDLYRLMYNFDIIANEFPEDLLSTYKNNYNNIVKTVEDAINTGKFADASVLTMVNTAWAFAHGMALLLVDNIVPGTKNLNSLPQLLNDRTRDKKVAVRDIAKFSVDMIFEGLTAKKKPSGK